MTSDCVNCLGSISLTDSFPKSLRVAREYLSPKFAYSGVDDSHPETRQLAYKAAEAGLPVEAIDPAETSITCRECGKTNPVFRDGDEFDCWKCGYEVHADMNAAINIAQGSNGN